MASRYRIVFLLFALVVSLTATIIKDSSQIKITPRVDIIKPEPGMQTKLGVVNGVRSCGGDGKVIQLRYESCTHPGRCTIPGDGKHRLSEMEFVPSKNIAELGIRFTAIYQNGTETLFEMPIPNRPVQEGEVYWTKSSGGPTQDMIGQMFTFQYGLYNVDSNEMEVCAEADFDVVQP